MTVLAQSGFSGPAVYRNQSVELTCKTLTHVNVFLSLCLPTHLEQVRLDDGSYASVIYFVLIGLANGRRVSKWMGFTLGTLRTSPTVAYRRCVRFYTS